MLYMLCLTAVNLDVSTVDSNSAEFKLIILLTLD